MTQDYRKRAENFLVWIYKDHLKHDEALEILESLFKTIQLDTAQEARREELYIIKQAFIEVYGLSGEVFFPYPPIYPKEECDLYIEECWSDIIESANSIRARMIVPETMEEK